MKKTLATLKTLKTLKKEHTKRGDSVTAVFMKLRDLIVQGQIAPGSWVVEAELAERLGFSRTPVRGALQLLQREGFIVEHRGGTKSRLRISPLTKEDAQELYTIVGQLEGMAGVMAAALPVEERKELAAKLSEVNHRLNQIATSKKVEPRSVFELDTNFHHLIVEAASGPRLRTLHQTVKPQIERYWRLYAHSIIQDLHLSVSEHSDIIESILSGNPRAVERALEANWKKGAERICHLIELFGERGSW
jgi:DNA-binding GntR family transcriptional regulator